MRFRGKVFPVFLFVLLSGVLLFTSGGVAAAEPAGDDFLKVINAARTEAGLAPLGENETLNSVAGLFAADMAKNNYLSYRSPTYGSIFTYLKNTGFSYRYAGVAIMCGPSATAVAHALVRKNSSILSGCYDQAGVGIAPLRTSYIVVALYTGGSTQTVTGPPPTPPQPQPEPPAPVAPSPAPAPTEPVPTQRSLQLTADEQAMFEMVNRERLKAGLKPLSLDPALTKLARLKAEDMVRLNYFSHISPTYGSPFEMMRAAGISYRTAGENLAGASSVERAFSALMNSPGHRANILSPAFTRMGIGVAEGSLYGKIFVQLFAG
ncbi:MAG: CAP domain-containing protein [Bacillota bacterium]